MAQPALQVCPICALDDDVAIQKVDDEWVMTCASAEHPPFEWRPASQYQKTISYRTGIGEELGVYDTLLECLLPGLSEYGVIEYRFSQADPSTYRHLLDRYGHTAIAPSKYTTSSFLGGALGALWREGAVTGTWGPATGYWSYNQTVGTYGPAGTPADRPILSWTTYATDTLGVDPATWPPVADHP